MMSWRVEYKKSIHCVEYVFIGSNSGRDVQNATSRGIETGRKYGTCRYLVDLTQMEFRGSIVSLFELPAKQYGEENLSRQSSIAVILPVSQSTKKDALFYESASVNRGWNVKCFESRSDAVNWLTSNNN